MQFENISLCDGAGLALGGGLSLPFSCSGSVPVSIYSDGASAKALLEQFRDVVFSAGGRFSVSPSGAVAISGPVVTQERDEGAKMSVGASVTGSSEVAGQLPAVYKQRPRTEQVRLDPLVSRPLPVGVSPEFARDMLRSASVPAFVASDGDAGVIVGRDVAVTEAVQALAGFGGASASIPVGAMSLDQVAALQVGFPGVAFVFDDATSVLRLSGPAPRVAAAQHLVGRTVARQGDVQIAAMFASVDDDALRRLMVDGGFRASSGDVLVAVGASGSSPAFLALDHLASRGRAVVVARPRLSVRSGASARFQSGDDVPSLGSTSIEDGTVTQEVVYIPTGTVLNVAATVLPDGRVRLRLDMEISAVTGEGVGGNPVVSKSSVSSEVYARVGDTLLLGGLDQASDQASKGRRLGILPQRASQSRQRRAVFLLHVAGVR